ncbi:thiamine ABC transporter substrate-binding protein [Actinobacillus succinogenes]|uniref:Thiamine-binding periplasmic protein n=1 Tax=Actinobacillus succinogenes (strain ATCC 55618 / DSM 22257 / CCUG 43843 / 130Z) TaxID=339671 RepID=A6VNE8_ACTSZ|nr:thiamine ABC transporter substrate binding subunit [Actinobacillus succinogenes]ABR74495.1 thiamine ABC transporter, periplasmic binding protein [Actinobacillus succinogenes 130Z]PHI41086.1 thiamine ABC transporter substrate-binding protein [Actinobacillus succinogenes]
MLKKHIIFSLLSVFSFSVINSAAANAPLQVYTEEFFGADWGPGAEVKALFEQVHPRCRLDYRVFDGRNTMLNRLRLEGKKTKADVVIGLDNFQFDAAEKTGLFAKTAVNLTALSLPVRWTNQTFIPYEFGQFAFIYDKNKLKNPPESLKELVERQDLRVIYQDPRTSSMGRGFIGWMNVVYPPQRITEAWRTLAKHTVTVGKGWTETYGAFLKGEADMVFSHNTSPLYHLLKDKQDRYAAARFGDGNPYQFDTVAKIAGKNHVCADEFIDFLLSAEAQKIIIPKNVMLSSISAPIEPHFDQLKAETLNANPTKQTLSVPTDATVKQWIEIWQTELSR